MTEVELPPKPDPAHIDESRGDLIPTKLGTVSTSVWVYEKDIPFEVGDVVRYAERRRQRTVKRGRVIDIVFGKVFLSKDKYTETMSEPGSASYPEDF